ncbi:hypothetical protein MKX01_001523 [Papaver californicum]|nr:hypothetical protein MKX01_001523 [Papaver californicum]
MDSATLATKSSSYFGRVSSNNKNPNPSSLLLLCIKDKDKKYSFKSLKTSIRNPISSSMSCSVVTETSLGTSTSGEDNGSELVISTLERLVNEFETITEPIDKVKRILHYANLLPRFEDSDRVIENRVMGCTAQVWLVTKMDEYGKMRFYADSDSEITKGFCSCLIMLLDGALPEGVLKLRTEDLFALNVGLSTSKSQSRVNTWHNVLISMQKKTKRLVAERQGKPPLEPFPSLVITADDIHPKGSYAESQAKFLFPDELKVTELVNVLKEKKIGVAAHFYMDPEVQGILTMAQQKWPHIYISDSLVMADMAVKMAKDGCQYITVLGVDFMSENVRAILDQAGFEKVGVYRMSDEIIGCSLADAAASPTYTSYLEAASKSLPSLHVVYINTSLETKARAHELVPTITCTSSNVVNTILQAFSQVPDLNIWYGPDSYMGANIAELFQQMANMTNEEITLDGACIVHDIFGNEVVNRIQELYADAYLTAHFEVPGEMFTLAMEAKRRGMGVVGSTQNILDFIQQRVQEALDRNLDEHLQFVLGTETGMATSIVAAVRKLLGSVISTPGRATINVEIIFPVCSDSVSRTSENVSDGQHSAELNGISELSIIPGVATGEGCSIHGGCASCPYMKMNTLNSLLRVCQHLPNEKSIISSYEAGRFDFRTPLGNSVADVGCEPILHMRDFQATGKLPGKLVDHILDAASKKR